MLFAAGKKEWFDYIIIGLDTHVLPIDEYESAGFSYSEMGSKVPGKPSLVFVHGLSSNKETWIPIIKYIPKAYHCIAVDLPGHGETFGLNENRYSIEKFVEKLKLFFDKMELTEPMCLIGASMGGAVVSMFAAQHPQYVCMMCLLAPAANQECETDLIRKIKSGDTTALLPETPDQLRDMIANLTVKQPRLPTFFINGFLQMRLKHINEHKKLLRALVEDEQIFVSEQHSRLKNVNCATLILWGRQDQVYTILGADYYSKLLPHTKCIIVEDCGHFMAIDKPEEVAGYIVTFIEENHKENK